MATIADDLAVDVDVREKAIGQQLDQVETHKKNVVVRMTDLVEDALSLLNRASTLSELPEGIGPWEHRPFLVVKRQGQAVPGTDRAARGGTDRPHGPRREDRTRRR